MNERTASVLEKLNIKERADLKYNIKNKGDDAFFVENFNTILEMQKPVILENDDFGFNIYVNDKIPFIWGNVTPNYGRVITDGFDTTSEKIKASMSKTRDEAKLSYGNDLLECIGLCEKKAEEFREEAVKCGNTKLAAALSNIPKNGAGTFYEACVFMKLCIYFLRLGFGVHITLGRFDQYMYPFFESDVKNGASKDELFETLENFFISLNRDTDLYHGIQVGDNGQSMVLGGFDKDGKSVYNELSEMCMNASLELNLIDPKINLRVGKDTPDRIYELGTRLTKKGLGFPQYCNDDIVVPGLVKLGYDYDDAINYTVAACWEYIAPDCGADVPNIKVMDFPRVINDAVMSYLTECETFPELMERVRTEIKNECDRIIEDKKSFSVPKMPIMSVFFDGCIESLTDMWHGGTKYKNYGCHGTGIANAADALAAVKYNVYDKRTISPEELINALKNNFEGEEPLRKMLLDSPKMGNNDDYADSLAGEIMETFSGYLNGKDNGSGGIWRAGTGSAQEYVFSAERCPATADGRRAGDVYSSSFSPSIDAKTSGLLSVMQSFTKFDLTKIINGGPLTVEIHDTVLRNEMGIEKTARLVKEFINLGGHQLQINSINRERLLDAQKHPENYKNLIVRVWGWSGYFNELDVKFQNHIIRRAEY